MPIRIIDPTLRAGWEPDTPTDDSVLRRFLTSWTLAVEAEGLPHGARTLRRDDLAAVDVGRPATLINSATLLAPLFQEDVAEIMGVLDDFYQFAGEKMSGPAFLLSPWPTPDLRAHSWTLLDYQPLMFRPAGGATPPAPSGLRIEEVRDEAGLRAFELALVRGFAAPELEALGPGAIFHPGLLADERFHLWVGWEGERPVCAAATFVAAGINDVTIVATVPEARQRGYAAALTWRATLADPTLPALLIASAAGRPVYERLGYTALFRVTLWTRDRAAAPR